MLKKDVELGQVVEVSKGKRYLLGEIRGTKKLIGRNGWLPWHDYTENLIDQDGHSGFDIVAVYRPDVWSFNNMLNNYGCNEDTLIWRRPVYTIPEDTPIDTPVLVRNSASDDWIYRHFAGFNTDPDYFEYEVFNFGRTSWTSKTTSKENTTYYRYCKLAEEEE